MTYINALREEAGVAPREASGQTEPWRWMKRERGIELWLEARRLGDRRRWIEEDIPG